MYDNRDARGRYRPKPYVIVLRPSTRGMKARGTSLSRVHKGAKRAKGQFANSGMCPRPL